MKKERLDLNLYNTINYSNKSRNIYPIAEKDENLGHNYINEKYPNKRTLNKSLIINKELNTQTDNYFENYTNPINFTQQYPSNMNLNSFYQPRHNMIFCRNRISPHNRFFYSDGNTIYNCSPDVAPKYSNDIFYKDSIDAIQRANKQKVKLEESQNGINISNSNLENKNPLTILNTEPNKKKKNLIPRDIKNMINLKNPDDSLSLRFKKNKNKHVINISQIKPSISIIEKLENIPSKKYNKNKSKDSNNNRIYHNKNKSNLQSRNNSQNGKYNNKNDGIIFNKHDRPEKKSVKEKVMINICYDKEKNKYIYRNYDKSPKYGITNKIQRNGNKKKSFDKNLSKKYQVPDKSNLKKSINILEELFAISFMDNFYYFIGKLKSEYKRKLLLNRYRQKQSKNNYDTPINSSLMKNVLIYNARNIKKKTDLNNISHSNNKKSVYIPKKNMFQGHDPKSKTINNDNYSSFKTKEFTHFKNIRSRNLNENNLNSYYNSVNLTEVEAIKNSQDYSDDCISKKIKDFAYKNRNSLFKTLDNSSVKRRLNISNDKQKNNMSVNKLNNNSKIYFKPKAKMNLKKRITVNKKPINKSLYNKESLSSIIKGPFIKNNENKINNNVPNNNPFILINNDGFASPIKCNKDHTGNISDIAQDVIDNASINTNKINNAKKEKYGFSGDGCSDSIENENTNADVIEEIILEYSSTNDKKLSIFVKYIISPKSKKNFLEKKLQRLENMKVKGDNKELKIKKCTDSFQLISPFTKINSYFRNIEYPNHRKIDIKEVKEISEDNDSFIEDENKDNTLMNILNILEKNKKEDILYLKEYFFKQLLNFDLNKNLEELTEKETPKNNKNNFQRLDISILSDSDNNYNYSFRKDVNNIKDRENENQINDSKKEGNFQNEKKNYFSRNINMIKAKNLNKESLSQKEELRKENKLKSIIQRKINHLKYNNIRAKKYYFGIWKNNKSMNENCHIFSKNKRINENEKLICIKQKIKNFRLNLIKYILENLKKQKEEENEYNEEEEEDDEKSNEIKNINIFH